MPHVPKPREKGASGAVDTAGGAITAESALSDARASAGDEQSHRKLQSPTADSYQMACNEVKSDCSAPNTRYPVPLGTWCGMGGEEGKKRCVSAPLCWAMGPSPASFPRMEVSHVPTMPRTAGHMVRDGRKGGKGEV
ncbi:unnamed protein product [Closterium sp. NIES-64]|nr:unnamed protein product [Closterium sp. NIES-64]